MSEEGLRSWALGLGKRIPVRTVACPLAGGQGGSALPKAFGLRPQASSGFTLVELICVVVIVAAIAMLAAAQMDNLLPKYRLRAAAREVGAVLKQARTRAAGSGKDIFVEMDLSKGTYWILAPFPKMENGLPADPPQLEYQELMHSELPFDVEFVDVILGEKIRTASGRARVRFSPFGAANHTIVNLRNKEDRPLAVRMNGFTGNLTFHDGYKEADEILEDRR